ncbi:MAG: hypothetical protein RLZZ330_217 [Actinomycetota bacterium]
MSDNSKTRIIVTDSKGESHTFASTGLHEDYNFDANIYTGDLIVRRVKYGPRGTDEWAEQSTVVVGAWLEGYWTSVTQMA